jgi:hypothetical protein
VHNPYQPPKSPIGNEEEDIDPDWIYREFFGYFILLVVVFYMLDTLIRAIEDI